MTLRESSNIFRLYVFNGSLIDFSVCYQASLDQLSQPRGHVGIVFVVVSSAHLHLRVLEQTDRSIGQLRRQSLCPSFLFSGFLSSFHPTLVDVVLYRRCELWRCWYSLAVS
jgi:hypothetical protein